MSRLAYYRTPNGGCIELHHDRVRTFWTEHVDAGGEGTLLLVDSEQALEHYEYAERVGHVDRAFPCRLRMAAR